MDSTVSEVTLTKALRNGCSRSKGGAKLVSRGARGALELQVRDNAYDHRSSRESGRTDLLRYLVDLYEVLEAHAPAWYSSKLRRGLLAALKALGTRR